MKCFTEIFVNRPVPPRYGEYAKGHALTSPSSPLSPRDSWEIAKRSKVFIDWFTPITRDMLQDKGCLEVIIARSSGYDHIDIETASEQGVCVANQPELISEAVAEFAVTGILAVLRRLPSMMEGFKEWWSSGWPSGRAGWLLYGRSLGLLGAGRIGQAVALKLRSLGVTRVYYYSRTPKPSLDSLGAKRVSLEYLFENSDILVNSLPLTGETRGIVTNEMLRKLPLNAVYVNVGRGGTEEANAISVVAEERRDLSFVLDVHPEEPPRPGDPRYRYTSDSRFIVTPHVAGLSIETRIGTTILALMQAADYLDHGCLWNPVSGDCGRCKWGSPSLSEIVELARSIASRSQL